MRLIQKLGDWFDLRLQLGTPIRETAEHPVPRETASWFYVFGSAALTCFNLEHETCESGAAEYIEPACGLARNRVFGSFANRRSKLQPEIEPVAEFLDQAHVVFPPALLAAGSPGVGISPALMRSFPSSIL